MKKKILSIAGLMICFSLSAAGTMAYFTAEEKVHNVITTGDIDIELVEWGDEGRTEPFPEEGVDGVMPGSEVTKIVEVANTGGNAAWVRVKVEKAIRLDQSQGGEEADLDLLTVDINTAYWTEKDGFYYYGKALEPGDTTEPLFTSVAFAGAMDNLYRNAQASVTVQAYATQAANNGAAVMDAKGWPEL